MNAPLVDNTSPGGWQIRLSLPPVADEDPQATVRRFREALAEEGARMEAAFRDGVPIESLVAGRAALVDALLVAAWAQQAGDLAASAALVAVGGYGRGELHPGSDIDLLVLLPDEGVNGREGELSRFLAFLWDIGLEVGHSVRTLAQCASEAARDLTVVTTLMEARRLAGPEALVEDMRERTGPARMWDSAEFFRGKREEQQLRHQRYHDTGYNLEPNVKGSPGGLRDIQVIGWIARRHLGVERLDELVAAGFLTGGQLRIVRRGVAFLWKIRWGLHLLTGRREDRLLFDHQVRLAKLLGYEDASYTLAVEQMMQRYYRTVMELSRINEMLLQLFEEAILLDPNAQPEIINARFQVRNGYLGVRDQEVFNRDPCALMEIFLVLEQNPEIRGVSAHTIGLIKRSLTLIDEEFRQNPRNHRLFMEILRAPQGVSRQLRRMNLYGVLGLYIPAFGRIVGRMQFDLFHVYTVDAHTLFVVENLRRLALPRFDELHPEHSRIMQSLPKPEIAYLAGLFHDIAKGRGGDHSELGALDAEAFCLEHGLSLYDARLVAWLVRNHLVLSLTAQKKDISAPEVISEFARLVGDESHLDYLYVLTVSDVRATNPKLWNSWKASLFHELYEQTRRALLRGLENPIDVEQLVDETQQQARVLLGQAGIDADTVTAVWARFTREYFLRHQPAEIAWHTQVLSSHTASDKPLVSLRAQPLSGGTAIMVYSPYELDSFARVTAVLDELALNIVGARIVPTGDGHSLDTYTVLGADGTPVADDFTDDVAGRLQRGLEAQDLSRIHVTRRPPRQTRAFNTPVEIRFSEDRAGRTVLELVAADRPGLLYRVGRIFRRFRVDVRNARITTVGERAEDVFYITDRAGHALSASLKKELEGALIEALSQGQDSARPADSDEGPVAAQP
ncbi:MAG: [protein-PII] uridylyltransferase [Gammaproteobacteria bacterium]|nr:[protein-PII] uridylyltransferase [Gammaproteobacteria bacterium]